MENRKKSTGNTIVTASAILAASQILVRVIGLFYRVPMQRIIGDIGNGYYGAAYEIYQFILLLSANGIPTAVALLVSRYLARREYKKVNQIFKGSMLFALVIGGIVSVFTFFAARWLAVTLYGESYADVSIALRVLAPTLLVSAVMGVYRGFFQGRNVMLPTALSQLIEQIFNAVVSIIAAYLLIYKGPAYGAAGSTLGTLTGAVSGLIFVAIVYYLYRPTFQRLVQKDKTKDTFSTNQVIQMVAVTMAPVVLSSTIYQLSGIIDTSMFYKLMAGLNYAADDIAELFGNYSGQYKMILNVPLGVTSSIGIALIPAITSLVSVGKKEEARDRIGSVIKLTNIVSIPSCIGLIVLAGPIMNLLYVINNNVPMRLLQLGAITVITYSLSTVTIAILQGMEKMKVPVINSAISLAVHIVVVYILIRFVDMNIYALIYGNLVFSFVMCVLNLAALYYFIGYRQEIERSFLIPAAAALIMGFVTFLVYKVIYFVCGVNLIAILVSIVIAVAVYAVLLILFGGMNKEEVLDLPKGTVILTILQRVRLM